MAYLRASLLALVPLVSVLGAACGSSKTGASQDPTSSVDTACTELTKAPSCGSAIDVGSRAEIEAHVRKLTEVLFSMKESAAGVGLLPTPDLRATTDIELDIASFCGTSGTCTSPDGGSKESWFFSGEKNGQWRPSAIGPARELPLIEGVACKDGCTRIAIKAGTVVRFQRVFEPYRFASQYPHYVRVVRPCAATCASDELPCSTSTTCIAAKAFCTLCEGKSDSVCACRAGCSVEHDGARCEYQTSEDTGAIGTCQAGSCQ